MENETDEVVSGVRTLAMAVEQAGPLSFADILDLGAEVAGTLADRHDDGAAHGHVGPGAVVRLDDGPWRLAPPELIPDVDPVRAPELAESDAVTPAADVYALGATLSYGLTGAPVDPIPAEGAVDPADGAPVPQDQVPGIDDPAEPDDADDADGADPEATAEIDLTELAALDFSDDAAPMTLPEVMTSFLVALRSSLAADPATRPAASDLAATLRQLRSDADSALGGALVGGAAAGAVAAVTIGDGAAAEPWGAPLGEEPVVAPAPEGVPADAPPPPAAPTDGALSVEGTGSAASLAAAGAGVASSTKTKKSLKERAPMFVAVAAVVLAAVLGVSLVRERNDKSSDVLAAGPTVGTQVRRTTTTAVVIIPVDTALETTTTLASTTTTSTSTTIATVEEETPETTAPTTTAPTTTAPTTVPETTTTTAPTTTTTRPPQAGVPVTVVCGTGTILCPAKVYSEPSTVAPSQVVDEVANGVQLVAQCGKDGEQVGASKVWFRIIGQGEFFWIPKAAVTNSQTPPFRGVICAPSIG